MTCAWRFALFVLAAGSLAEFYEDRLVYESPYGDWLPWEDFNTSVTGFQKYIYPKLSTPGDEIGLTLMWTTLLDGRSSLWSGTVEFFPGHSWAVCDQPGPSATGNPRYLKSFVAAVSRNDATDRMGIVSLWPTWDTVDPFSGNKVTSTGCGETFEYWGDVGYEKLEWNGGSVLGCSGSTTVQGVRYKVLPLQGDGDDAGITGLMVRCRFERPKVRNFRVRCPVADFSRRSPLPSVEYEVYGGMGQDPAFPPIVTWTYADGTTSNGGSSPVAERLKGQFVKVSVTPVDPGDLRGMAARGTCPLAGPLVFDDLWPRESVTARTESRLYVLVRELHSADLSKAGASDKCGSYALGATLPTVLEQDVSLVKSLLAAMGAGVEVFVDMEWDSGSSKYVWTHDPADGRPLLGSWTGGITGGRCVVMTATGYLKETDCTRGVGLLCARPTPDGTQTTLTSTILMNQEGNLADAQARCSASDVSGSVALPRSWVELNDMTSWLSASNLTLLTESSGFGNFFCHSPAVVITYEADPSRVWFALASPINADLASRYDLVYTSPSGTTEVITNDQMRWSSVSRDVDPWSDFQVQLQDALGEVPKGPVVRLRNNCDCAGVAVLNGQPRDFTAVQRDRYVYFSLTDFSSCERKYVITKDNAVICMQDSSDLCSAERLTTDNMKDLIDTVHVGTVFQYCARAVGGNDVNRDYVSARACVDKRVAFDGRLTGTITTASGGGAMAMVNVRWWFSSNTAVQGTAVTDSSGKYSIAVLSESLDHDEEVINLQPEFVQGSITHVFENAACEGGKMSGSSCFNNTRSGGGVSTSISLPLWHLAPANQVNLLDLTSFPIAGVVSFDQTAEHSTSGRPCPVGNATVCAATGSSRICVQTDADGRYSLGAGIGSTVTLTATYSTPVGNLSQVVSPQSTTLQMDSGKVADFAVLSSSRLNVSVYGATCRLSLGDATVMLTASSDPSRCTYAREVQIFGTTPASLAVPPIDLVVQLVSFPRSEPLISTDDALSYLSRTLRSERRDQIASMTLYRQTTVDYVYHSQPRLQLVRVGRAGSVQCGPFWTIRGDPDLITTEVYIEAFEEYGSHTCAVLGNVSFWDGVSDLVASKAVGQERCITAPEGCSRPLNGTYNGERSSLHMSLVPGVPSIVSPYAKRLRFQLERPERQTAEVVADVVVTGQYVYPNSVSDEVATAKMPLLMLFDPPGDSSYAQISQGTTLATTASFTATSEVGGGEEAYILAGAGGENIACVGFGVEACQNVANFKILGGIWNHIDKLDSSETSNTIGTSVTLTTDISTSSYAGLPPPWGDVVVVGTTSFLKARVLVVKFNTTTCSAVASFRDALLKGTPGYTLRTIWDITYTDLPGIKESLKILRASPPNASIPNATLIWNATIREMEQGVKMWQGILDYNVKARDVVGNPGGRFTLAEWRNMVHVRENTSMAFDTVFFTGGGTSYGLSLTSASSSSSGTSTTDSFSGQFGAMFKTEGRFVVVAWEVEAKAYGTFNYKEVTSNETEYAAATTTSLVLSDANIGDKYNVQVMINKDFKTPVFRLLNGVSECPVESGTVSRTGVSASIWPRTISNIPQDNPAIFELTLSNTAESGEAGSYDIVADDASNPDGLELSINGLALTRRSVSVPATGSTKVTLVARRGPKAYNYSGVHLRVVTPCEDALEGGNGLYRPAQGSDVTLSVDFLQPCPSLAWSEPWTYDNDLAFTLNSMTRPADQLVVKARNLLYPGSPWSSHPRLQEIRVEYQSPVMTAYSPAVNSSGGRALLVEDAYGFASVVVDTRTWKVEGLYKVRLVSQCAAVSGFSNPELTSFVSTSKQGLVDYTPPAMFGTSGQPLDGTYWPGDEISLTFVEPIDCNLAYYPVFWNMTVADRMTGAATHLLGQQYLQAMCDGANKNRLQFAFAGKLRLGWLPGNKAQITVRGVRDPAGNSAPDPFVWAFSIGQFDINQVMMKMLDFVITNTTVDHFVTGKRRATGSFESLFCSEVMTLVGAPVARCKVVEFHETDAGSLSVQLSIDPGTPSAPEVWESIRSLLQDNKTVITGKWSRADLGQASYTFSTTQVEKASSSKTPYVSEAHSHHLGLVAWLLAILLVPLV